jgi:hypothetical protein
VLSGNSWPADVMAASSIPGADSKVREIRISICCCVEDGGSAEEPTGSAQLPGVPHRVQPCNAWHADVMASSSITEAASKDF